MVLGGEGPLISADQVKELVSKFGAVEAIHFSVSHSALLQVIFTNVEDASKALQELKGKEVLTYYFESSAELIFQ